MSASLSHPRYRASIDRRWFGDRVMWVPLIDGVPAEGGETEDHCFDEADFAMEVAVRIARHRAMEAA